MKHFYYDYRGLTEESHTSAAKENRNKSLMRCSSSQRFKTTFTRSSNTSGNLKTLNRKSSEKEINRTLNSLNSSRRWYLFDNITLMLILYSKYHFTVLNFITVHENLRKKQTKLPSFQLFRLNLQKLFLTLHIFQAWNQGSLTTQLFFGPSPLLEEQHGFLSVK